MELEERLKPTCELDERCAETFDLQILRPEVPIKLHRPFAMCVRVQQWTTNRITTIQLYETAKFLSPPAIFFLESWHHWYLFPWRYFWVSTDCGAARLCLAIQKFHQLSPRHAQFWGDFGDMFLFVFRFWSPCCQNFAPFSKAVLSSEAHKADVMHPGSRLSTFLH